MAQLDDLIGFLTSSPSPWHVVSTGAGRLSAAGFEPVQLDVAWDHAPTRGFASRGAALVAWSRGSAAGPRSPVRLVGAHTDSPGLRIKPRPDGGVVGWKQLGVEVYGGALLNSWLDRDLAIAGRVALLDGSSIDAFIDEAVCRVPQLAIHLDRDVNERGLILDKQQHLSTRSRERTSPMGRQPSSRCSTTKRSAQRALPVRRGRCWRQCSNDLRCRPGPAEPTS
jgi:aspartyl aminopeptidase